ncbi:hypothetical protein Q4Q39_01855 [Flavivirga amylovorans]|uniref:Uncharacterized protein n=1 Tax=Flavivirga amylovorans TaxID=870486 RepID=A0ABT8WWS1_9FLAO|nr:hypothetical protein [Flavivirga amylovorans]MDO5986136.1 hypothetical protein [Flavivirga amylovorans]
MGNEIKLNEITYFFEHLANENSCKDFFHLNSILMSGVHIMNEDQLLLTIIKKYYNVLCIFYNTFYGLELDKETKVGSSYFYLSFND